MKSLLEDGNKSLFSSVRRVLGLSKPEDKKDDYLRYLNGSISNATKDLIMTFPVMCDNSLPISTASMISKAHERNIITMLQLLFSAMQMNSKDGREVISKIHTNLKTNYSIDDVVDVLDDISDKKEPAGKTIYNLLGENIQLSDRDLKNLINEMTEALKTMNKSFPVESLSETSLNDFTILNVNGNTIVREAAPQNKKDNEENNKEDKKTYLSAEKLLDSDVKKANELAPSLIVVQYNELEDDAQGGKKIFQKTSFVAGVKSRLIAVDNMDIVERIVSKNKTALNFLNFIRATTGEIHIVKDFLLSIDQAKIDAKNSVKKGQAARMWKALEARAIKNNRNKLRKEGNNASAITVLVLSQETVNFLKTKYDFDIENLKNATMILEAYNLMGLFIADESIEVVKSLYDGNTEFESTAYQYLRRENNNNSTEKAITNLLGQANRR